jgi:hypothetical protein
MPKLKEFFSLLKEQGKINNPKFDEAIEKSPDFEIDPEAVKSFEDVFMTPVRAASHPDVIRTVRYQALMPINRDFEKIINSIAEYDKDTANVLQSLVRDVGGVKEGDTYRRMETLSTSLGEVLKKIKAAPAGGDEDLKKELDKKEQMIKDFTDKFTNAEKTYKEHLSQKEKEFQHQLHEYKLDGELEKLAGTFTLAEAYEKTRKDISEVILTSLKKSNALKLDQKDGQTVIQVLDEQGAPKFNGNTPVTINSLLEEKYKPFLKQSNADGQTQEPRTKTHTTNGQKPGIRRGSPTAVQ